MATNTCPEVLSHSAYPELVADWLSSVVVNKLAHAQTKENVANFSNTIVIFLGVFTQSHGALVYCSLFIISEYLFLQPLEIFA